MRRVTRFKRSTAPSKAWIPNARPQCCCQAPQPRSGAPKAQGLIAARWPQHNRLCRRSLPADAPTANNISTGADGSVALQLQSRISTNLTDVTRYGSKQQDTDAPASTRLGKRLVGGYVPVSHNVLLLPSLGYHSRWAVQVPAVTAHGRTRAPTPTLKCNPSHWSNPARRTPKRKGICSIAKRSV